MSVGISAFVSGPILFQSTSSEEDVVSSMQHPYHCPRTSFNPRPPKRTLCPFYCMWEQAPYRVSIHVLRRGRCVFIRCLDSLHPLRFNPRPPKRTLCPSWSPTRYASVMFQSTSSEEDVVSRPLHTAYTLPCSFNPRPPKRTLCRGLL